jgi:hypothetical protein
MVWSAELSPLLAMSAPLAISAGSWEKVIGGPVLLDDDHDVLNFPWAERVTAAVQAKHESASNKRQRRGLVLFNPYGKSLGTTWLRMPQPYCRLAGLMASQVGAVTLWFTLL